MEEHAAEVGATLNEPPEADPGAAARERNLREEAARVVALLPPPTPEQLSRLRAIFNAADQRQPTAEKTVA